MSKLPVTIPPVAWLELITRACDTLDDIIAPLAKLGRGVGGLIEKRFNELDDSSKRVASQCLQDAYRKVKVVYYPLETPTVKVRVFYEAFNDTENQCNDLLRELWSNLLAREMTQGTIHPEIAKLVHRLTSDDALLLVSIAQKDSATTSVKAFNILLSKFKQTDVTYNHLHLKKLGLIRHAENYWLLTTTGRELIRSVCDPF